MPLRLRSAPLLHIVASRALSVALLITAGADAVLGQPAVAHADSVLAESVVRWITLAAPPGGESRGLDLLRPVLPAWTRDGLGNLIRRVGSGFPRRMIACAMDGPSYVVSGISEQGYVRLHRVGAAEHPLIDQFHEALQLRILTVRDEVTGVIAIANGHFARQHRGDTSVVSVDQLRVDVGTTSASQTRSLGIAMLDPVIAWRPVWTVAGHASGPAAGARASCAAAASAGAAATAATQPGETIFVLSSQRSLGWVGLAATVSRSGRLDALTLLNAGRATGSAGMVRVPRLGASRRAYG